MVIEIGSVAPSFELPSAGQNRTESLTIALEKSPVLISFYRSSCLACKVHLPFLEALSQRYSDGQLAIWGISLDSSNVTESFMRRYEISFPNLVHDEPGYPLARAFGIMQTPSTFLISQDSKIVWTGVEFSKADLNDLAAAVANLVGGEIPEITANSDDVADTIPGCPVGYRASSRFR